MASLFRKGSDKHTSNENIIVEQEEYIKPKKEVQMKEDHVTLLTSDVEFKGTISFQNILKIDGKFEGDLYTNEGEVIIGSSGSVKANVKVKNAVVEGKIDGNISASEKVELRKNAKLIGDLQAKRLVIEEGVTFVGKCNVHPEGVNFEKPTKNVEKEPKMSSQTSQA